MNYETLKVRKLGNSGWFRIENELIGIYGKIIGATGVAIYASLCRHADKEQKCFPSQKLIAEELGISERNVRNYIHILEDTRLIAVKRERVGRTRAWKNNVYYLLDRTEWWKPEANGADGVINDNTSRGLVVDGKERP
jgi:hypothetical protein